MVILYTEFSTFLHNNGRKFTKTQINLYQGIGKPNPEPIWNKKNHDQERSKFGAY
jgi:hypothetical protein